MNSQRLLRFAPLFLFVFALIVRLPGLTWGLPTADRFYSYHPDERQMLGAMASLDFFNGDFNPNFFNYPSLFIYLASFVHTVASLFAPSGSIQPWQIAHNAILHARLVSAVLGALTVPLVFGIGRNLGWKGLAVFAALLCALIPGHVQHSHFAAVDVASTFFIALALWFTTRAFYQNELALRRRSLLLAGLAAGLGAATKYNAVIVAVAPFVTAFLLNGDASATRSQRALLASGVVVAMIVGFLIGCPYSLLSPGEFWGDGKNTGFAYELLVHPRQGSGDLFVETGNGWIYHAWFNAPFLLTAPLAIAALVGLVLACRRDPHPSHRIFIPLLAFSLLYFAALGTSQVRFMRYLIPLVPPLCIFVAVLIQRVPRRFAQPLAAILAIVAAVGSLNVLSPFMQQDPRDQALAWMNTRPSTEPLRVGLGDTENPLWFYTPPFWPQDTPPGSGLNLSNVPRNPRYDLVPIGLDATALTREKPAYFVWSELQWRERERLGDPAYARMRTALAQGYAPTTFATAVPLQLPGRAFVPHDFLYTHPSVEVWARKSTE